MAATEQSNAVAYLQARGSALLESVLVKVEGDLEGTDKHVMPHRTDLLKIAKEAVMKTKKRQMLPKLVSLLDPADGAQFRILSSRVDSALRAWYKHPFEQLVDLYRLFDPLYGAEVMEEEELSVEDVEALEIKYLRFLFFIMDKCNYRMVTDRELEVASDGNYLLSLPVEVDSSKLDSGLFTRFFKTHNIEKPSFADKYLIFRRGVGKHSVTDYFFLQKLDLLLQRMWMGFVYCITFGHIKLKSWDPVMHDLRREEDSPEESDTLSIERIHMDNIYLSLRFFLSKVTIQEPTFERVIILHRPATPAVPDPLAMLEGAVSEKPGLGDRSIICRHFRQIPMADMEIVLPEKKTPGLTPRDTLSLSSTFIIGVAAVISAGAVSLSFSVIVAMAGVFATYMYKIYYSWQVSMATYQALLQTSMIEKQLDSGHATLLHLSDDVLNQEYKEVMISYFILLTTGSATKADLDKRCEAFMTEKFNEQVQFDVEDAAFKLLHLKMAKIDSDGLYTALPLVKVNAAIGKTTDEVYGREDWEPTFEARPEEAPTDPAEAA